MDGGLSFVAYTLAKGEKAMMMRLMLTANLRQTAAVALEMRMSI